MTAPLLAGVLVLAAAFAVRRAQRAGRDARVGRRLPPPRRSSSRLIAWAAPARLVEALDRGALAIRPEDLWPAWPFGAGTAVGSLFVLVGPAVGVVAAVILGAGPIAGLAVVRGRRDRLVEGALPEALEAMARSLRTGASLRQAVTEAAAVTPGPLGTDLARLADEAEAGIALPVALGQWEARRPLAGIRLTVAALGLGAETGGAQARAVDGVAETIRSRSALAGEVRALSSQAKMSGLVIAVAPVVFAVLASASDGGSAAFLLGSPLGLACLTVGLSLDVLAAVWMNRLARVEP